jgi:serine-type D-Ala-D-Ala carboxypeptidase/endopeptidase
VTCNPLLLASLLAASLPAHAMSGDQLAAALDKRLRGDRTGACVAAAVIEDDQVSRAFVCADPRARRLDERSALEIGSVTKTMTATLLAQLIGEGKASLDDPLAKYLPPGTRVPEFDGQPIRLRHLVTHTSGLPALPPDMPIADPDDPYAQLAPEALLAALQKTTLGRAPGTQVEYSNYAMMLLSYAVARTAGSDFESVLDACLFGPLGMHGAYVRRKSAAVRPAKGHLPNGRVTPAWTIHPELSGVGGVRATLDDMVRYVQAQWRGTGDPALDAAIRMTHAPIALPDGRSAAMNWMRQPWRDGTLYAHEGGTGGFSSLVAFVPEQKRGVVLLSDTALTSLGGLGAIGMHLLDPSAPLPPPRKLARAPAGLLEALTGEYLLGDGLRVRLWHRKGVLYGQTAGQPVLEFGYDDAGDFFPLKLDALLSPRRQADGRYGFVWSQGGGEMTARRVDPAPARAPYAVAAEALQAYVGRYPLMPDFALAVSVRDGRLHVQGTGQAPLPLDAVEKDVFVADAVGAELRFERDASGGVVAVTLVQHGQRLRGERER